MTREDLITTHPLIKHLEEKGVNLRQSGKQFTTESCPVTRHKKGHLCVSVDPEKQVWFCNDCGKGGSVIDWEMFARNESAAQTIERISGAPEYIPTETDKVVAIYPYTDENGNLKYEVVRYKPKNFRQRHEVAGEWVWNLQGVARLPYKLPKIIEAKTVVICEGEKDADMAEALGFNSTCCSGGSNGWLAAYGDYFRGKDVIIIPHDDAPGRKYADAVQTSIQETALSIKRIQLPKNDLCDFVGDEIPGPDSQAAKELGKIINRTPHSLPPVPLYGVEEMEEHYRESVRHSEICSLRFGNILPSLEKIVRKVVPGELVLIVADTSEGKTVLMQTIARSAAPLPSLIFELELPLDSMFERFAQMEFGCESQDVERDYRNNNESFAKKMSGLRHILICPESGLTAEKMEHYIRRSEQKFGKPPVLVCVDYVQLMRKAGSRSRYESTSENAEQLKIIAKKTNTIIIMLSQVSRPKEDDKGGHSEKSRKQRLHAPKDSGSLENSAGLVLECWLADEKTMKIQVLKNTKGQKGAIITCDFNGATMTIKERDKKEVDNEPEEE